MKSLTKYIEDQIRDKIREYFNSCEREDFMVDGHMLIFVVKNLRIISTIHFLLYLSKKYAHAEIDIESIEHYDFYCIEHMDEEEIVVKIPERYPEINTDDVWLYYIFPYRQKGQEIAIIPIIEFDDLTP